MARNSGIIGPLRIPTSTIGPGIHDMFNVYNYRKANRFPTAARVSAVLPTYTYNEGQSASVLLTTYDFPNGTLFVKTNTVSGNLINSDFSSPSNLVTNGSTVNISSGSGSFSFTISNDATSDGTDVFYFSFHLISTTGPELGRTLNITINDTSTSPAALTIVEQGASPTDPGRGFFIDAYNSGPADDTVVNVNTPFPIYFNGQFFNKVGLHSNSYIVFSSNTATNWSPGSNVPYYSYTATNPAFYSLGVSVASYSAEGQDTGAYFLGYRTIGTTQFQLRFEGYWPWYAPSSINRIWNCLFDTSSNQILLDTYQMTQEGSSPGNRIRTKTTNTFNYLHPNVTQPNTRYLIT